MDLLYVALTSSNSNRCVDVSTMDLPNERQDFHDGPNSLDDCGIDMSRGTEGSVTLLC